MKESEIQKLVAVELSANGVVSFKNNTGQAWTGSRIEHNRTQRYIIIRDPRPIYFGLIRGGSDQIGWKSILITPEMVGKKIAVFSAIECKTKTGRISQEQNNFLNNVVSAGGIAFVARAAQDVVREINSWITRLTKS